MRSTLLFLSAITILVGQVPYGRILHARTEPGNWLTYSGDYQAHGYSMLDQINTQNIAGLKVAWMCGGPRFLDKKDPLP